MRVSTLILLLLAALLLAGGCGDTDSVATDPSDSVIDDSGDTTDDETDEAAASASIAEALADNTAPLGDPGDSWQDDTQYTVTLSGSGAACDAPGASWSGGILTLADAGCYTISGALDDGRIVVDAEDLGQVTLVLDGVTVHSSTNAPLAVLGADLTLLYLAEGSTNTFSDASDYVFEDDDDEPNAAVFSKDDLVVDGPGALVIDANYNDGLTSKDALLIVDGEITIDAVDDGVRGKDSLVVRGGTLTIDAGGDALKSDEDEDASLGYVYIAGGDLQLVAGADGIQGETDVLVDGGSLDITCGGGHTATLGSDDSAKGLKAGVLLIYADGDAWLDTADDALHSDHTIRILGGALDLQSGDDAVHGEYVLEVGGGEIEIGTSYEGLESRALSISGGTIRLYSTDDGLNAAGATSGNTMDISGGWIYVDSLGDGVDCNGSITMSGGTLLVAGPSSNGNGALDYDGSFRITGGVVVAVGSSGMAQTASSSSSQNALLATFSTVSGGNLVHLETSGGTSLCTFRSTRSFGSLAFSSPALATGSSYRLYTGGTCTGSEVDGYYAGGAYSGGTLRASFTVGSRITTVR